MAASTNLNLDLFRVWYSNSVRSVVEQKSLPFNTITSRYRDLSIINSYDDHLKFARKGYFEFKDSEKSYYITKATEFRPDIVSVMMYNDPRYSWALLAANKMKSFFDFEAGKYIMVPNFVEVSRALGGK